MKFTNILCHENLERYSTYSTSAFCSPSLQLFISYNLETTLLANILIDYHFRTHKMFLSIVLLDKRTLV